MYTLLVVIHTLACLALILIVLLQTGKGADMGAAFGGASQTLFGSSGGNTFLSKLTTGAAIVFMLTCLSLSYFAMGPTSTRSVMEKVDTGPALPEAKPVQPMPEQSPAPQAPEASKAGDTAAPSAPTTAPAATQSTPTPGGTGAAPAEKQPKQ